MGTLYDLSQRLSSQIEARFTDPIELIQAKGTAASVAGFMISLVTPGDADDPELIARLRDAAAALDIEL